ncbi:MAG: sigma-70 family RNA polymerase sigma factor [Planctomycetes bacterium]|jgi:RNA polymerase sigma-70 factor (ECF subfamily)|nr:sigma-70 family RNA polymerase sigma factor [Planctomycetota bacterium]
MSESDEELVRRSRRGDREAFGELVVRYENRIHATVFRILGNRDDAREFAQDTFLRAFDRLSTFRDGARFSTWLYTIALNVTRSELRRRKARRDRRPLSLEQTEIDPPDGAEAPEEGAGRRELAALALRELDRLDTEAREVVVLRDLEDLSYEEIAGVLGCPPGTVKSRLFRAREELRARLAPLLVNRPRGVDR